MPAQRFARRLACLAAIAVAMVFGWQARAQDFYAGKRLTILVNYDAGGPTDLEARLVARHIARHIPGNPTVLVQNMGGAGGIIGARYLGEKAPRDGTMVGYFTAAAQHYVIAPEKFQIDFRTYEFVAYMPSTRIHVMRRDIEPGMQEPADILNAKGVVAGGLAVDSPKDIAMRMVLDMAGVPHKYVTGYNSSAQAILAFERGEIGFYSDSPSIYISRIAPSTVATGKAIPFCFDPVIRDGAYFVPRQVRTLAMPACPDLLAKLKGGMPTGALAEAYAAILSFAGTFYRSMQLPPGSPPAAVAALRQAMLKLGQDKDYIEEAQRTIAEAPEYLTGDGINEEARRLLTITPELKVFIAAYVAKVDRR